MDQELAGGGVEPLDDDQICQVRHGERGGRQAGQQRRHEGVGERVDAPPPGGAPVERREQDDGRVQVQHRHRDGGEHPQAERRMPPPDELGGGVEEAETVESGGERHGQKQECHGAGQRLEGGPRPPEGPGAGDEDGGADERYHPGRQPGRAGQRTGDADGQQRNDHDVHDVHESLILSLRGAGHGPDFGIGGLAWSAGT